MSPKQFSRTTSGPLPLEPTSQHGLRPLTILLLTPRSTRTYSLSPGLIGAIVAGGILALLCAAGAGFALHVHYCRQSGCSVCCAVIGFKWWRGHSTQARGRSPSRVQTQGDEYSYAQTPHDRVNLFEPSIQEVRMASPMPLPSLTPPPTLHTRGPQSPDISLSNSVISIRRSPTPSVISDDYAPTLRASEVASSFLSPRNSPTSLGTRVTLFGQALDGNSNLSEDFSTITLPSFVEQERPNPIPSPIPIPLNLGVAKGVRSFASSSQSSFRLSRPRSLIENTTPPTTPPSTSYLRRDLPSPSLSASNRLPQLHRTQSSHSRRAGAWQELATAKLKSAAQAETVNIVRSGTPVEKPSRRPRTNSLRRDVLSPLMIPGQTLSVLGDYGSSPFNDCCPPHNERDPGTVSGDLPQSAPPSLSSHEASPVPEELECIPPTPYANHPTKSPSLYHSPVLDLSPSSHTNPDGSRSRVTSRTMSSMSTIPSISAFPSPPDLSPARRDKALSILTNCSTSRHPFSLATLRESISVRTTSPNKGQASTRSSDAGVSRPTTTVNRCSVLSGQLHAKLTSGDKSSNRSGFCSRITSLRRLSRVPLGPRQMDSGPKPSSGRRSHSPSV